MIPEGNVLLLHTRRERASDSLKFLCKRLARNVQIKDSEKRKATEWSLRGFLLSQR
jgi:hypothetical protein